MSTPKTPAEPFDMRRVRELADILTGSGLTELEVEGDGLRIRIARTPAAAAPMATWAPTGGQAPALPPASAIAAPTGEVSAAGDIVSSPMVGTVYLQAQPGAEPFVKTGDTVAEGQTLLLIEAMKTMNPIAAPRAGRIIEFLVADAQPVEYGEPLVVIG
jgi:acetyl-CoA carboxylase biotin carboxyl carrier protein